MTEDIKQQIGDSVAATGAASIAEGDRAGAVAQRAVVADPVLMNELNAEPWWQSGILWFGTGGILWAVGVILTQVATHGITIERYNMGLMVAAVGALASPLGVLYRRFWPGLKPLFWRWTQ